MGLLSNRVTKESLKPGDHIYAWRTAFIYAHHGIYVGDNTVIHFTRHGQEVGTGTVLDRVLVSSVPAPLSVPCHNCTPHGEGSGVVSSCLDCFLAGDTLCLFEYGVSPIHFLATRGGTCTLAVSNPADTVVHRAKFLLKNGFGSYNVFKNNCEHFAMYCKTGKIVLGEKTIGLSGQVMSIIGGPISALRSLPLGLVNTNACGIAASAVVHYCATRYAADIGMRSDAREVPVEYLPILGLSSAVNPTDITSYLSGIEVLNGTNFKKWKEQIGTVLRCLDLDYALREPVPTKPETESSNAKKALYEKWERSNCMSLMIMKSSIEPAIRGAIPDSDNALNYMKSVEEQLLGTSKSLGGNLMNKMMTMKYDGHGGVREHIMKMSDMASQLKELGMEIPERLLVSFIMTSLPAQFGPFKTNYNTQKDKWTISELIAMCVQEEEGLKAENPDEEKLETENPNVADLTVGCPNIKPFKKGKCKKKKQNNEESHMGSKYKNEIRCFFCRQKGHKRIDCPGFISWLEKKGLPYKKETKEKRADNHFGKWNKGGY